MSSKVKISLFDMHSKITVKNGVNNIYTINLKVYHKIHVSNRICHQQLKWKVLKTMSMLKLYF